MSLFLPAASVLSEPGTDLLCTCVTLLVAIYTGTKLQSQVGAFMGQPFDLLAGSVVRMEVRTKLNPPTRTYSCLIGGSPIAQQ